jgi:mRNA-degrading endonuclease toxin of MazEF toxin-antitoxin module
MKPWDIFTWSFPDAGTHPAVILGTDERLRNKAKVNVLLCSSHRATRGPELHEVILDQSDGLDWATLCKCDLVYAVPLGQLTNRRGTVTPARRSQIAERIIRALGFAGL